MLDTGLFGVGNSFEGSSFNSVNAACDIRALVQRREDRKMPCLGRETRSEAAIAVWGVDGAGKRGHGGLTHEEHQKGSEKCVWEGTASQRLAENQDLTSVQPASYTPVRTRLYTECRDITGLWADLQL